MQVAVAVETDLLHMLMGLLEVVVLVKVAAWVVAEELQQVQPVWLYFVCLHLNTQVQRLVLLQ
jgi:uncharacterized membrane protein